MSKRKGTWSTFTDVEHAKYLDKCGTAGGSARGFREWIEKAVKNDPLLFEQCRNELISAAVNHAWRKKPRDKGPDLFSIGGVAVPEFVTRPSDGYVDGEDENGDGYVRIAQRFVTVKDLVDNATIKSRKASEMGAVAKTLWDQADEARKRAKGNMASFAKDVADK